MTSNNPDQSRVPTNLTFYDKHPLGPISNPNGSWKDDLARKGLKVSRAQLKLIKDYMLGLIKAKIDSGEWESNELFVGVEGAKKRIPLIDAAKEKFGVRFGWDRIPKNHKDWVDRALAKLLVILKSSNIQEIRKNASLHVIRSLEVPTTHLRSSQNTTTSSQVSLSALPPPPSPPPTNDGLSEKSGQFTKYIDLTRQVPSLQPISQLDQGIHATTSPPTMIPTHPIRPGLLQPESYFQIPSSSHQQLPTTSLEGIYQQMTLVVINAIIKRENADEQPWEDILVEYLTRRAKPNTLTGFYHQTLALPNSKLS
ncbi:hypothetical protein N431DRAFT_483159 [Stipitochalara longipes BDJ]|nr:hypothetical protein N431DRAFT_483159 [Stipitochalara longipes BDJ]